MKIKNFCATLLLSTAVSYAMDGSCDISSAAGSAAGGASTFTAPKSFVFKKPRLVGFSEASQRRIWKNVTDPLDGESIEVLDILKSIHPDASSLDQFCPLVNDTQIMEIMATNQILLSCLRELHGLSPYQEIHPRPLKQVISKLGQIVEKGSKKEILYNWATCLEIFSGHSDGTLEHKITYVRDVLEDLELNAFSEEKRRNFYKSNILEMLCLRTAFKKIMNRRNTIFTFDELMADIVGTVYLSHDTYLVDFINMRSYLLEPYGVQDKYAQLEFLYFRLHPEHDEAKLEPIKNCGSIVVMQCMFEHKDVTEETFFKRFERNSVNIPLFNLYQNRKKIVELIARTASLYKTLNRHYYDFDCFLETVCTPEIIKDFVEDRRAHCESIRLAVQAQRKAKIDDEEMKRKKIADDLIAEERALNTQRQAEKENRKAQKKATEIERREAQKREKEKNRARLKEEAERKAMEEANDAELRSRFEAEQLASLTHKPSSPGKAKKGGKKSAVAAPAPAVAAPAPVVAAPAPVVAAPAPVVAAPAPVAAAQEPVKVRKPLNLSAAAKEFTGASVQIETPAEAVTGEAALSEGAAQSVPASALLSPAAPVQMLAAPVVQYYAQPMMPNPAMVMIYQAQQAALLRQQQFAEAARQAELAAAYHAQQISAYQAGMLQAHQAALYYQQQRQEAALRAQQAAAQVQQVAMLPHILNQWAQMLPIFQQAPAQAPMAAAIPMQAPMPVMAAEPIVGPEDVSEGAVSDEDVHEDDMAKSTVSEYMVRESLSLSESRPRSKSV